MRNRLFAKLKHHFRSRQNALSQDTDGNAGNAMSVLWTEGTLCTYCKSLMSSIQTCLNQGTEPNKQQLQHWQELGALFSATTKGCHLCSLIFGAALPLQGASASNILSIFDDQTGSGSAVIVFDRIYDLDRNTRYAISIKRSTFDFAMVGNQRIEFGGPQDAVLELQVEGLPVWNMIFVVPTDRAKTSSGMLGGHDSLGEVPKSPLCPCTDDSATLNLAQWWLQTCLAKHDARCNVKPVAVSASPARLLHLDIGSSKGNLRVVEVQDLPSMPVYLTLSYVWGSQKAVRLEMSNLEAMKAEIDLDSLPRTIRDAIIFTRALGYHYLWIDSLCIIQDSAADWATEAAKMGSIYWGSMLTLAALHASGSHEGLFSERNPLYDRPLRIPGTSFEITNTLNLGLAEPDSPQAPLQTRGWVVQERIMARRTLFFGSLGLFWECSCCAASESDVLGIRTRPDDDPSAPANFKLALHKALGDNANLMLSWSGIRSYYTKCNLTREKDRPIAISGLMNFIAAAGNAQHAHGMWLPFIVRELCWEVASIGQRPTEYESPSWSWMSAVAPIEDTIKITKYRIQPEHSAIMLAGPGHREPLSPSMDSEALQSRLQARPAHSLALLVRGMWRVRLLPGQKLQWLRPILSNEDDEGDQFQRAIPDSGEPDTWHQDVALDPLPTEAIWVRIAHYKVANGRIGDVGIVAVDGEGGLQRIGIKKITYGDVQNVAGEYMFHSRKIIRSFQHAAVSAAVGLSLAMVIII